MKKFLLYSILTLMGVTGLRTAEFGTRQELGKVNDDRMHELSGMVAGRTSPGILWAHNDSGDEARVFAMNKKAELVGVLNIKGAVNYDWEDIGIGPGPVPGANYLYIGDHGDNDAVRKSISVVRVQEPDVDTLGSKPFTALSSPSETIRLKYPDGARDAESMFVDPASGDIYIISKRETKVRVYRAAYPQSTTDTTTLEYLLELPYGSLGIPNNGVTAADISPDGKEILIKTYLNVYYYTRAEGESITDALKKTAVVLSYTMEPQGEAICWDNAGAGFYTISELGSGSGVVLYFYPRLGTSVKKNDESESIEIIPSDGYFVVNFGRNSELPETVGLYNVTGKAAAEINVVSTTTAIPENGIASGLYFLVIKYRNRVVTRVLTLY